MTTQSNTNNTDANTTTHEQVQDYYSNKVQDTSDLRTSACTMAPGSMPTSVRAILKDIHQEIKNKFYGCGSPIPPAIEGKTVLDLGCGTGRDVYTCSKLVGSTGHVFGVDMTDEQLEVANRHRDTQAKIFGLPQSNVTFLKGNIEDLKTAGIKSNSIDVIISNCVINLSPDKNKVFSEIFRVLKPGGELYFSDVFSDRRLPVEFMKDQVLTGECLAGAMYIHDFRRMLQKYGINDYRVVTNTPMTIQDDEINTMIGMASFSSQTIRAFKLDSLEDLCEDYGQIATYLGTITNHAHSFALDDHHTFATGKPMLVCGNTAAMVSETRLAKHFTVTGNRKTHFGEFPCGSQEVCNNQTSSPATSSSCCC